MLLLLHNLCLWTRAVCLTILILIKRIYTHCHLIRKHLLSKHQIHFISKHKIHLIIMHHIHFISRHPIQWICDPSNKFYVSQWVQLYYTVVLEFLNNKTLEKRWEEEKHLSRPAIPASRFKSVTVDTLKFQCTERDAEEAE